MPARPIDVVTPQHHFESDDQQSDRDHSAHGEHLRSGLHEQRHREENQQCDRPLYEKQSWLSLSLHASSDLVSLGLQPRIVVFDEGANLVSHVE